MKLVFQWKNILQALLIDTTRLLLSSYNNVSFLGFKRNALTIRSIWYALSIGAVATSSVCYCFSLWFFSHFILLLPQQNGRAINCQENGTEWLLGWDS